MIVFASQKEYRDSFKRHLKVYRKAIQDGDKQSTHCMILFYAVECGLKALILRQYGKESAVHLVKGEDSKIISLINDHNLNPMIDDLRLGERFQIPKPEKEKMDIKDMHSVWRYRNGTYKSDDGTDRTLEYAEHKLDEISKVIEVRLR